jgi:hypothetical protein
MSSALWPPEKNTAHYPLDLVFRIASGGDVRLTQRVEFHMARRGWYESDVTQCLQQLVPSDFLKSQAHRARNGIWLDIYKPWFGGERLYVKFTMHEDGTSLLVLSYCGDGEEH